MILFLTFSRIVQILGITKNTSLISFPPTAENEVTFQMTSSLPRDKAHLRDIMDWFQTAAIKQVIII